MRRTRSRPPQHGSVGGWEYGRDGGPVRIAAGDERVGQGRGRSPACPDARCHAGQRRGHGACLATRPYKERPAPGDPTPVIGRGTRRSLQ